MDNGEILAYDYSSEPLRTVNINGYWGQPTYAPVVTLPPAIADDSPKSQDIHWGQFSGEPILEVYIFHYDLPCQRIDGTPPTTTKSQE